MKGIYHNRFFLTLALAGIMCAALLALPGYSHAHGVVWEHSSKKAYGLEFAYDDETPMAYAEIKVFGPNDQSKLSQTGRADKNGYFAFIPDADGQWLVAADDGAGHLAKADLTVSSSAASSGEADGRAAAVNIDREIDKATKPLKIGLVVSIFLNLAFISMAFKRKKNVQGPAS